SYHVSTPVAPHRYPSSLLIQSPALHPDLHSFPTRRSSDLILTSSYGVFLALRAMGGVGWAMFATVATTAVVDVPAARRQGREHEIGRAHVCTPVTRKARMPSSA